MEMKKIGVIVLIAIILVLLGYFLGQNIEKNNENIINVTENQTKTNGSIIQNILDKVFNDKEVVESCAKLDENIRKELNEINYCSNDEDCKFGLPLGVGPASAVYTCGIYYNKNADFSGLIKMDKVHLNSGCIRNIPVGCPDVRNVELKCNKWNMCAHDFGNTQNQQGSVCGNGKCEGSESAYGCDPVREGDCVGNIFCPQDCSLSEINCIRCKAEGKNYLCSNATDASGGKVKYCSDSAPPEGSTNSLSCLKC